MPEDVQQQSAPSADAQSQQQSTEQTQTQQPAGSEGSAPGTEQGQQGQPQGGQQQPGTDQGQQKAPWYQGRINDLTREKHDARRETETERTARMAAETRAANAERLLQAIRQQEQQGGAQGQQPTGQQGAQPTGQQPPQGQGQQQHQSVLTEADVERRAQELAAQRTRDSDAQRQQQEFQVKSQQSFDTGKAEFPDFEEKIANVGLAGEITPEFLHTAVFDLEHGHRVLYHLGQNPQLAAEILRLPPTQQAVRLAKIDAQVAAVPPAKPVSGAPAPIKTIDGTGRADKDPSDMSMDEWIAWREKQIKNR